jgi:ribonuclease D
MARFITDNAPKPQSKLHRTDAQKAVAAELKSARTADAARRLDTRRKVVIGGALVALAERDPDAAKLLTRLKTGLTRPADIKLFET